MRRKRRFTWLPILGSPRTQDPGPTVYVTQQYLQIEIPAESSAPVGFTLPVLGDEGEDDSNVDAAQTFINDSLGQEYIIERVVGTIHCAALQVADAASTITVSAGFFVAPKDGGTPDLALGDDATGPYSPLWRNNCDQPWMWRRTWILGNLIASGTGSYGPFPPTNAELTDTTGPAVDIRSVRRVHKDERLWLSVSAMATWLNDLGTAPNDSAVRVAYDIRALGAMRRAQNTSTFRA